MVDDILLNKTQQVSAARETPEILDSDWNENDLGHEKTKEKIEWCKHAF